MTIFKVFAIVTVFSVGVYGQTLKLLPYKQEDCETNCTHGLISETDTVVFKAELDYSQDLNFKYIYFQRKTRNAPDFIFLKDIVVNGSVVEQNSWEPFGEHLVKITVRVKATKTSSGARLRGVLLNSKYKEIISEEQIFPEIQDSNEIKSKLLISGIEMSTNEMCKAHVTGSDIIVIFECESQVLPCLIEMSATDLMTPLHGKGYVIHTSRRPELNITIKYASCTLEGQVNTITCSVSLESTSGTEENKMYAMIVAQTVIILIMGLIISGLLILLLRKRECTKHVMKSRCTDCSNRNGGLVSHDDADGVIEDETSEIGETESPSNNDNISRVLNHNIHSRMLDQEDDNEDEHVITLDESYDGGIAARAEEADELKPLLENDHKQSRRRCSLQHVSHEEIVKQLNQLNVQVRKAHVN